MIENILAADELRSVYLKKRPALETESVDRKLVESQIEQGWTFHKALKKSVQLTKPKSKAVLLEDRVWCLMYRMGFQRLSGDGGAKLLIGTTQDTATKTQVDVVAIDPEVAIAVECKSMENAGKKADFDRDIAKHAITRDKFINAVNQTFPQECKRVAGLVLFTHSIVASRSDMAKADDANVVLLNEKDLDYYEKLVTYLGRSARYQFLADILRNRHVPSLDLTIPAIKGKMGGYTCYTFSISPEYLLKVGYVSHRARNQESDDTYQRMVAKSRLADIRLYITNKGMFPTNIVVSFDPLAKGLQFNQTSQEGDKGNGVMGWLTIKPSYGSAWIIDGQHRLYAYSDHPMAASSLVSVLAFDGLPSNVQATLFIDVNNKQQSVKRSHLVELYAKLKWDAVEPSERVDAIVSKAVAELGSDRDSILFGCIQRADDAKTEQRCLTVQTLHTALAKGDFYIAHRKSDGSILAYGPLWGGDSNQDSVRRTVTLLNRWFGVIRDRCMEWWELGSAPGGGLAMNDSIKSLINVLRSALQHLEGHGVATVQESDENLSVLIAPFADILGQFLAQFSTTDRNEWRVYAGSAGQIKRTRRCQEAIQEKIPEFDPQGLAEFQRTMKEQTNDQAQEIIGRIERTLQSFIIAELKSKLGEQESGWWMNGVPKTIRLKAAQRREDDNGSRGGPEYYLDLIDYRTIAQSNFSIFQNSIYYGRSNDNKDKRTAWIAEVNDYRNVVMHASSGKYVSLQGLQRLKDYDSWLKSQVSGSADLPPSELAAL